MKLTAIVVDDEALARQVVREYLSAHPEVELVAECANGFEAVKAITERRPDLLFLDIQMPKLDGFEVLELVGDASGAVVFITAHEEHAIRAFEVHAVDYLLKPIAAARFDRALESAEARARDRRQAAPAAAAPLAELAAAARGTRPYLQRIAVRDGTRVTIIPVAKLDYASAEDDYVALVSEGKRHLKQQTIAALEAALDPAHFVRIHRGIIVNLERIARIEPLGKDSHVAVLQGGEKLPISRPGLNRLRDLLAN